MIQAEQVRTSEPAARRAPAIAPSESAAAPSRRAWVGLLSVKRLSAVYLGCSSSSCSASSTPDTFLTETTFRLVFSSGVVTCVLALAFLVPLDGRRLRPLGRRGDVAGARPHGLPLDPHRHLPVGVAALIAVAASRGMRRGVRLHHRPAARQLVHRDARREPGAARRGPADLRTTRSWSASSPRAGRTSATTTSLGIPIVVVYLLALSRWCSGTCSSSPASAATCSRPAATRRPRAWPASRPTAWSGASFDRQRHDRRPRRRDLLDAERPCSRRASARATCSRPSPPCSSAPRSSRSAPTSGAR